MYSDYSSLDTYDADGAVDYLDVVNTASGNFDRFTLFAGQLTSQNSTHPDAREGYILSDSTPRTPREWTAEYWNFDWEFGNTPEQTSFQATASTHNNTFVEFSDENQLSVYQRGFKTIISAEADEFLRPWQLALSTTVKSIEHSDGGVRVLLADGTTVDGDDALCTFSLGVLQNNDVWFHPRLPAWKNEAIHLMKMTTFTKIFLRFEQKFWFDTQFGLYADEERGRYPVWQSLDIEGFLPDSGILFVTVTGEYSERIESLSNTQVQAEVMGVLRSMFPNISVPEPIDFFFPRWHSDPLYRGSFSNWPPLFTKEHQDNLRANVGERLWFAGEATSSKYYGV
ncbi:hypothetical protein ONZ45_g1243 [Pleurotus djamor]|nr:hypothetical protein ONZ45_g1243 [Pleurotus djamor]